MSTPLEKAIQSMALTPIEPPALISEDMPYVTHQGEIDLGGIKIQVVQLNTGQRLLTGEAVEELMSALSKGRP